MEKAARRIAGICAAIAVVAAVSCAFAPEERHAADNQHSSPPKSPCREKDKAHRQHCPAKGGGKPFPYRGTSTPDSRGQGDFSVSAVNRAIGERMRDNPHVTTDARGALSLDSRVLFGYDSAELSEEGRESLTEFLRDYMRAVFDENKRPKTAPTPSWSSASSSIRCSPTTLSRWAAPMTTPFTARTEPWTWKHQDGYASLPVDTGGHSARESAG